MKNVHGWWLPDTEKALVEVISTHSLKNRGFDYQTEQRDYSLCLSLKYNNSRRITAIDIGGHVGLWACDISQRFEKVISFEPIKEHRECFKRNIKDRGIKNIEIMPYALGNTEKDITLDIDKENSGQTHVKNYKKTEGEVVKMKPLDSFNLQKVHYIKVDTEGYELEVLKGARLTIKKWRPIIILENKDKHSIRYKSDSKKIHEFLYSLGYIVEHSINSEVIFVDPTIKKKPRFEYDEYSSSNYSK